MATLIEAIAAEEGSDADMVRDVLLTYRYFTTPDELFNRLVERYPNSDMDREHGRHVGLHRRGAGLGQRCRTATCRSALTSRFDGLWRALTFRQRFAPGSKDAGKASNVPLRYGRAFAVHQRQNMS